MATTPIGCGASTLSGQLIDDLLGGVDFDIPEIDWNSDKYDIPQELIDSLKEESVKVDADEITTKQVNGNGVFDSLMTSIKNHLKEEFENNRITGSEYTRTYIALTEGALTQAVNFVLQRNEVYWKAKVAQLQALNSLIETDKLKAEVASIKYQAHTAAAQYVTAKINLANADAEYCKRKYENENILPKQLELIQEQIATQAAQTKNPQGGYIGKQMELYDEQISSYKKDARIKAGKLLVDGWATNKTIDEGALVPDLFNGTTTSTRLNSLISGL